ncbi:MAG: hypothetical protein BroJett011_54900 [Chloroflexota bacterium]|nr:MAG: hypothetical protein BroJett011_54900 [Chloroflexota bacterium]
MAKMSGSFFNIKMSGALGEIIFDQRGFVRLKGKRLSHYSTSQGDFRQTMAVAQKCAKVCGSTTRQLIKAVADNSAHWNAYLAKNLIGPHRTVYLDTLNRYGDPAVDRPAWEIAGVEAGLRPIRLEYAGEAEISPGAQLFILASTLFSLGLYETLGRPNGNAEIWKEKIVS